jgi:hypothetical protein
MGAKRAKFKTCGVCAIIPGWRCFRARVSALSGDGVEQLTAVPDNNYAKILQVLRRQARQDRVVDLVLAECRLVPFEAKAPQPTPEIHDGAPNSADAQSWFRQNNVSRAFFRYDRWGHDLPKTGPPLLLRDQP